MPKVTFSLDDETVRLLRRVSEQKRKAQSLVVREAIATRSRGEVDRELGDLRRARRTGWARPSD